MADNSLLNMFDPYNSGNDALPQSEPSTPVHATHTSDNEERTPLTLSTFFNRPYEPKRSLSTSPKRPDFAHAHQPLVQIDESLLYDPDINPDDFESNGSDSRSQSRQHTVDDLLGASPYGHMSVRGHPVLGASTSSLDSISLRDIGMSLNNSTMTSLLRIPAPPQLEKNTRERTDSSSSINTDTSVRGRSYSSEGYSSSVDISVPEASYLLDEPALLYNQQALDDDSSVNLSKMTPHFSTLPRRNRPSHVVLEDSSWIGSSSISPLQAPKPVSPAHSEAAPPEGSPILTPSPRKSRFAFIRRDKDSTPTAAVPGSAGPTPIRSASKPPSTTPRSTSPLHTPSRQQMSSPTKTSSFLNLLRGPSQESSKRSTPKAVTPAPSKPHTPVESSPASTVTSTNGRSGNDGLETPPDELGFKPISPVRSKFALPARSESKSPVRAESKSPVRRESKSPERPLLSRAGSKSTIFSTSSASATSTRVPAADAQTKASRRFSIRPVSSSSSSLATAASQPPPSSSSSSGGTRLSLSTKPSTITGISSRTSSVASRRVPASQVTSSAPAPRLTTSPFKVPPAPRPSSIGTASMVTATKVAASDATPAAPSAAARSAAAGAGSSATNATPTRRPTKIVPTLRPRSMIVTSTSAAERTTAQSERKPQTSSSRMSIGSSSSGSRLSVAPSSSSSRIGIAPSSSGPRLTSSVSASRLGAAGSRLSTVLSTTRRTPMTTTTTPAPSTVRASSTARTSIAPGPGASGPPAIERGVSHIRSRSAITTSVSAGAIGASSRTTTTTTAGASIARSSSMVLPGASTSRLSGTRRTLVKPPPSSATSKK